VAIHRYILTVPRRSYEFVITITYDVIAAHHDPLDIEAVGATAYAEEKPRNLLDLMFDPVGMRPFVEEWEKVAAGLLQRVRREAVGQVMDTGLAKLLERLRKYPGVADLRPPPAPQSPVLPITFRRDNERFSYFSLITTVGTPQGITAQELRVECMFPTHAKGEMNSYGRSAIG